MVAVVGVGVVVVAGASSAPTPPLDPPLGGVENFVCLCVCNLG